MFYQLMRDVGGYAQPNGGGDVRFCLLRLYFIEHICVTYLLGQIIFIIENFIFLVFFRFLWIKNLVYKNKVMGGQGYKLRGSAQVL